MSKYITCTFSAGMLPSEYAVTIKIEGRELSLFAPKTNVVVTDADSGRGLLEVQVVDGDHNVIGLPAEIFELGRRFIEYPIEQLKSA
ncbi:MAG: hypothetical protein IID61_14395 [SAR324 cluster bacterium]|nr:hypothetical protein [SAR324 cluster bacterium]